MSTQSVLYRNRQPRYRLARRRALKAQGIKPTNRVRAWHVTPSALTTLPEWILERRLTGLSSSPRGIWLHPSDAKRLCAFDRAAGGHSLVTKTEYRHCELCSRPLIGPEAENRRHLLETGALARTLPCGPNCVRDQELRTWERAV